MNSMGSIDSIPTEGGILGGEPMHTPVHSDHEMRIRIMAERYGKGRDIWTGDPLFGQALIEATRNSDVDDDDMDE